MARKRRSRHKRRYNPSYSYNRRRRRHRRYNPALSLRSPMRALTSGFQFGALKTATFVGTGMLANRCLRGAVSGYLPAIFQKGIGGTVLGAATAGALSLVPKVGKELFTGGLAEVVVELIAPYVPACGRALSGLSEFFETGSTLNSLRLGRMGRMRGQGEFLEQGGMGRMREFMEEGQAGDGIDAFAEAAGAFA